MLSHYEIMEYWKDKVITKDYQVGTLNNEKISDLNSEIIIIDWEEPMCWGCGRPAIDFTLIDKQDSIKDIWNNRYVSKRLQRCHIFAKQHGGNNDASNLFLLCSKCHEESPDTVYPKHFYSWVYNKRKAGGYIKEFIDEVEKVSKYMNINIEELANSFEKKHSWKEYSNIYKNAISKCGMHGFVISESTYIYSMLEELKNFIENEK